MIFSTVSQILNSVGMGSSAGEGTFNGLYLLVPPNLTTFNSSRANDLQWWMEPWSDHHPPSWSADSILIVLSMSSHLLD